MHPAVLSDTSIIDASLVCATIHSTDNLCSGFLEHTSFGLMAGLEIDRHLVATIWVFPRYPDVSDGNMALKLSLSRVYGLTVLVLTFRFAVQYDWRCGPLRMVDVGRLPCGRDGDI